MGGVEGIVLLKNDNGLLPLSTQRIKTIAVIVEVFDNVELSGAATTRIDRHINQGAPLDLTPFATGDLDLIALSPPRSVSTRWTGFYTPSNAGDHDLFVQFGGFSRVFGFRWRRRHQHMVRSDACTAAVLVRRSGGRHGAGGDPVRRRESFRPSAGNVRASLGSGLS